VKRVITGSQFDALDKARIADAYLIKPVKPQELFTLIIQKIKEKQTKVQNLT
jgi:hypothetical protein